MRCWCCKWKTKVYTSKLLCCGVAQWYIQSMECKMQIYYSVVVDACIKPSVHHFCYERTETKHNNNTITNNKKYILLFSLDIVCTFCVNNIGFSGMYQQTIPKIKRPHNTKWTKKKSNSNRTQIAIFSGSFVRHKMKTEKRKITKINGQHTNKWQLFQHLTRMAYVLHEKIAYISHIKPTHSHSYTYVYAWTKDDKINWHPNECRKSNLDGAIIRNQNNAAHSFRCARPICKWAPLQPFWQKRLFFYACFAFSHLIFLILI